MDDRLLQALACRNADRPPVWLMRQAGRYLPEFRALRKKYPFMEVARNPELAAAVTRMPLERFGMDAAILFSDILVVLDAVGAGLHFEEGRGPIIERPVCSASEIRAMSFPPVEEALGYVAGAIRTIKPTIDVPLIGFCGAPFTVASYLVEGGSSRDLKRTKQWMMREPESFHRLLDLLADYTVEYLRMQVAAGVDALQIFESWAQVLAFPQFEQFSLRYLKKLLEGVRGTVPVILFARGASVFGPAIAALQPACVSVDWNADLPTLSRALSEGVAIQGNLDPDVLYAPPATVAREVHRLLEEMAGHPGYIFNLGHGIKPDTPFESVKVLVETVKQFDPALVLCNKSF